MRYVVRRDELPAGRTADGSVVRSLEGQDYGLSGSSLLLGELAPGFGLPLHRHPVEEVFLLVRGEATFTVGASRVEAGAGDIVVVPAGVPHRFVNSGEAPLVIHAFLAGPRIVTEYVVPGDSSEAP
jgi:mannose-6-phosphate isomerase-like protein (cupin superfamily)